MDNSVMVLTAPWYNRGMTSMESSIPYSHGRRALVVKGAEEVENVAANSKYQDKVEGHSEEDAIENSPEVRQNSPRVSGACQDGVRELGTRMKKTETRWKIIEGSQKACRELGRNYRSDMDPGSSLGIKPRIG
ncbi:hypothetical protein GW17_00018832 [Ensete ventricosum]|nr:hypothetical protein GW17_00018832 [Ensete ventricosum]